MPITAYSTNEGRINEVKGEILAHAMPVEVLALGCTMKKMPTKQGDNITYRRFLPFGATTTDVNTQNRPSVTASNHLLAEGVTPDADQLVEQDVNIQQQQYGCLYSYTDKTAELHEDDIPEEMKKQCGERMGLVREMIRYGSMKACSNKFYAGGTTRLTVDEAISLNILRQATRTLKSNHAKMPRRMLAPSANYNTYAVEASYIVFVHTDAEPDIRDLPGFINVADYGSRQPINENELGSCESFRFVTSPELAPINDGGATAAGTGLETSATKVNIYPFIVCGEDAVFDVALRGLNSFNNTHISHTEKSKADPLGQRGYVGCSFWAAVLVANGGWMAVIEAGVTDL